MTAIVWSAKEQKLVTDLRWTQGMLFGNDGRKTCMGTDFFAAFAGNLGVTHKFFKGLHTGGGNFNGKSCEALAKDVMGAQDHIEQVFDGQEGNEVNMILFVRRMTKYEGFDMWHFNQDARVFLPHDPAQDVHLGSGSYHTAMALACGKTAKEAIELTSSMTYTVSHETEVHAIEDVMEELKMRMIASGV